MRGREYGRIDDYKAKVKGGIRPNVTRRGFRQPMPLMG
jgi:hypothetical protein